MNRSGILPVFYFIAYLLVQVMLFKQVVFFDTAFCFLYIAFILLLPIETNPLVLMLVGFLLGFSIDIFYDSLGLHAMSLVLVSYLRNYLLAAITPQGGYDTGEGPTLASNGLQWFLVYTIPLAFVHHAVLFFVEAGGFGTFWFTMQKIVTSLLFTISVILFLQYLSFDRRR
ncbi:MAG TPA: Rod shape-determining protein MreD [Cyclobacteriaceae bacterium]|nr:Rod shape-determining protein MreD [Cyclobacteriaceae bacterium]